MQTLPNRGPYVKIKQISSYYSDTSNTDLPINLLRSKRDIILESYSKLEKLKKDKIIVSPPDQTSFCIKDRLKNVKACFNHV